MRENTTHKCCDNCDFCKDVENSRGEIVFLCMEVDSSFYLEQVLPTQESECDLD